jgi:shikimate kinase
MRYFIIGFKNSGKTTFGKLLAGWLKMEFIDLDEYLENKESRSIPEIYSALGETAFRRLEWKALKEVVHIDHIVVSTGGGAPCNCDNMNLMEKYGDVIYLQVSDETLIGRLKLASKDRPVVLGKNEDEIRQYIADMRNRCEHHYRRAKYSIDGENINKDEVIRLLQKKEGE